MKQGIRVAVVLFAALSGCKKEELPQRELVRPVKLFAFGASEHQLRFTYPGRVYANQTVEVGFEVTGKLQTLDVVRGQHVEQGALLASLDKRDFENELAAATASHEEAIATHARKKVAADKNAISKQELDEAKAQMDVAEANQKIKQKQVDDTEIRADFEGIVANRYVENFQNIVAKEPVLSFQDLSRLEIRINVPEADMVRAGRTTEGRLAATFAASSDEEYELTLKEFATEADPVTQTFLVTLVMDRPDNRELLPGMTASVVWEPGASEGGRASIIPATAVAGMPDADAWVWVVDPGTMKVSRRPVEIGQLVAGDMVELRSGLEPGEIVAAAGVYFLEEGMQVTEYRELAVTEAGL